MIAWLDAHPWVMVVAALALTVGLSYWGSTLDPGDVDAPDDNYPWFL